ncbi:MAG: hypothetical protein K2P58_03560 [Hyphomonadaceae bacterium]|nr:hypothetical protein [Hyphomonadaceae bacterium]
MTQSLSALALLLFVLAACAPPQPPTAVDPSPDAARAETFSDCVWGEVQSAGVSVWSFACPRDRLVPDPALPGFVREVETPEGVMRAAVIVLFTKAETDPLIAVLPAVRAASPGAATATCEFEEMADLVGHYQFMPTGEARAAYDALIASGGSATEAAEPDYMPCGVWGPSENGQRVFTVVRGAEDRVAAIDVGSDITIFDPSTLRASE